MTARPRRGREGLQHRRVSTPRPPASRCRGSAYRRAAQRPELRVHQRAVAARRAVPAQGEDYGLKLLYAQGFRNPSIFEAFYDDEQYFLPVVGQGGATGLRPENISSYEVVLYGRPLPGVKVRLSGWEWRMDNILAKDEFFDGRSTGARSASSTPRASSRAASRSRPRIAMSPDTLATPTPRWPSPAATASATTPSSATRCSTRTSTPATATRPRTPRPWSCRRGVSTSSCSTCSTPTEGFPSVRAGLKIGPGGRLVRGRELDRVLPQCRRRRPDRRRPQPAGSPSAARTCQRNPTTTGPSWGYKGSSRS